MCVGILIQKSEEATASSASLLVTPLNFQTMSCFCWVDRRIVLCVSRKSGTDISISLTRLVFYLVLIGLEE